MFLLFKEIKMNSIFIFGNYAVPHSFIDAGTVKIASNRRQDLDSYRDGDGILHRNALSHTATTFTFSTGYLYENEMQSLMEGLRNNYINYNERDANCRYFDPENNCFKEGHMYLDSNTEWEIHCIVSGKKVYAPIKLTFVEY